MRTCLADKTHIQKAHASRPTFDGEQAAHIVRLLIASQ